MNVLPDLILQHHGTNVVTAELVLVDTMGRTDKEVLPLFKIACGGLVQLLLAIITKYQAGEHIALACCRSAVSLLSDFLHLVEHLLGDNRRVGAVENLSVFDGVLSLFFVSNGVGVGSKFHRRTYVLLSL